MDKSLYKKLLWKKINIARKNREMSWARLAMLIGIDRRCLCTMRGAMSEPRASRCLTIAQVLGLTVDELLDPRIDIPETFRTDPENRFYPPRRAAEYWKCKEDIQEEAESKANMH